MWREFTVAQTLLAEKHSGAFYDIISLHCRGRLFQVDLEARPLSPLA